MFFCPSWHWNVPHLVLLDLNWHLSSNLLRFEDFSAIGKGLDWGNSSLTYFCGHTLQKLYSHNYLFSSVSIAGFPLSFSSCIFFATSFFFISICLIKSLTFDDFWIFNNLTIFVSSSFSAARFHETLFQMFHLHLFCLMMPVSTFYYFVCLTGSSFITGSYTAVSFVYFYHIIMKDVSSLLGHQEEASRTERILPTFLPFLSFLGTREMQSVQINCPCLFSREK